MKFSKINTNVVLKKNPVSLGKLLYFFLSIFHLWKGNNHRTNCSNYSYTYLLTHNHNSVFVGWGALGFTSPFSSLVYSEGIVPINQSMGKWKTYYDTHSILQYFSLEHFSLSFWGKYSSDSASSRSPTSGGFRVMRKIISRTLSNSLFLNCLNILYFELPNDLMLSIFGKFTRLVFI